MLQNVTQRSIVSSSHNPPSFLFTFSCPRYLVAHLVGHASKRRRYRFVVHFCHTYGSYSLSLIALLVPLGTTLLQTGQVGYVRLVVTAHAIRVLMARMTICVETRDTMSESKHDPKSLARFHKRKLIVGVIIADNASIRRLSSSPVFHYETLARA